MLKNSINFLFILIVFTFTGCTAINEGLSYKRVYDELAELSFNFYNTEKVEYGDDVREFYLKITPESVTKRDVIYFIHGGGWKSGTPQEFEYLAHYFTKKGYRVVLAGYPLVPDVDLKEMNNSLANCFLKVFSDFNSSQDTSFILGGASAGSHLAANLYFDSLNEYEKEKNSIKALFSLSGVLDFDMCKNGTIKGLIKGISDTPSNPVSLLNNESNLPIFLLYSVKDGIVEYENSLSFSSKAESLGYSVTHLKYVDYTHDESYVYPFLHEDSELSVFESWLSRID